MSSGLGRCEYSDCVQKECGRLNENGAVYDFKQICGEYNEWKWFEGKNKKSKENIMDLEDLSDSNTNYQEETENV